MVEGRKRIVKPSKVSRIVQKRNGELRDYNSVRIWRKDLRPTTQRKALYSMRIFTIKTVMNPDQFLVFAESNKPVEFQDLIDKSDDWMDASIVLTLIVDLR